MIESREGYENSLKVLGDLRRGRLRLIQELEKAGVDSPERLPHVQALESQALSIEEELEEYRQLSRSSHHAEVLAGELAERLAQVESELRRIQRVLEEMHIQLQLERAGGAASLNPLRRSEG